MIADNKYTDEEARSLFKRIRGGWRSFNAAEAEAAVLHCFRMYGDGEIHKIPRGSSYASRDIRDMLLGIIRRLP